MKTSDYKSFAYLESGDIVFSEFETIKSSNKLDSGSYKVNYLGYPENKVTIKQDSDFEIAKMHNFSDKDKIDRLFESFFNKDVRTKIETMGFCHKIGILLYGMLS